MNQKHVDETHFIAAHAGGLRNRELAEAFGISEASVKRRKRQYGLGSNCPHNNTGRLAEALVADIFRQHGLHVMPVSSHTAPFDLLVDGWRVEVKVGQRRENGAVQFRLPTRRGSNRNQYLYHKDYQRDTDYFALAVMAGDTLDVMYVLPATHWQDTITLHPDSPFCEYLEYRNRWWTLKASRSAA